MTPWERCQTALRLLAVDPVGLSGIALRARSGPVRDGLMADAAKLLPPIVRLHPAMGAEELHGGIDLAETLRLGGAQYHQGLLARRDATLVLPMAERCTPQLAHLLSGAIEASNGTALIALDEGVDETERLPEALSDRLAFHLDLGQVAIGDMRAMAFEHASSDAGARLDTVETSNELPAQLVHLCAALGIASLRAPTLTLRAAKAHAAFSGRNRVNSDDIETAAALVLASRATRLPSEEQPEAGEQELKDDSPATQKQIDLPDELLIEAVKAALPPDLLSQLTQGKARGTTGSGTGQRKTGNRRGRPLPARNKRARSGERIDLMATLRAAVPWQSMRKRDAPERPGAIIRPEDLRAKRYEEHSDRLLIFTVDASGSAALARLGEAKGAVELLLAEAYARRDHVALIAFRGAGAEELLPPTRSLVQTKQRLAELPGGGGTPTAAGLRAAAELADHARRRGMTPTVVLLTDGRSNVALDGKADRAQAAADATSLARSLARLGVESLVIDTGKRPEAALAKLASEMRAPYIAMPRADARSLSTAVNETLGS
jgi:magnesium chelatase subunit D